MATRIRNYNTPVKNAHKIIKQVAAITFYSAIAISFASSGYANDLPETRIMEGHSSDQQWLESQPTPYKQITPEERSSQESYDLLPLDERHIWVGNDIWINDIGTLLFKDRDRDGYFSGFSLTVDADTHYSQADVYLTINIQHPQGELERLHTTGVFSLYRHSLTDEYRVEIELVQNYPLANYDLYIELIDANNGRLLDNVGADTLSNLSGLPLEDEESDIQLSPLTPVNDEPLVSSEIRVVEYGGAGSGFTVLLMGARTTTRP